MEIKKKSTKRLVIFSLIAFSTVLLGAAAVLVREALHASQANRSADSWSRVYENPRSRR